MKKKISLLLLLLSAFSFAQTPQIDSFSPYSAAVGEEVTISGSGFDSVASNNIVYFGGIKASVTSATSTQLTVLVPAHATDSPISVTSSGAIDESTLAFKVTDSEISSFEVSASIFDSSVSIPSISNAYSWYEDDVYIAVADFNLDGKPDVAKLGKSTFNVRVHKNTSTLSTINISSFDSGTDFTLKNVAQWSIAAKDINSDGLIDIISHGQDFVSILINNSTQGGAISFETFVEVPVYQYKYNLEVADFDGDGLNDFVIQSNYTQPVNSSAWRSVVYLNTSTSAGLSFSVGLEILTNEGSRELASGDINGDGLTDLISSNNGKIHINTSTPGSISFSSFNFSIGSDITSIFDIDNDGDNDLISAQGRIFINNISDPLNVSPSDFSQLDLSENTAAGKGDKMSFGDINSDGKMDFLVNENDAWGSPFQLFINNSDGVLASTSFSKFAFSPFGKSDVIIIDVDGDNAKDVILCNMDQPSFLVIQNMLPYQPIINSTASFIDFETCNQTSSDSQSFTVSGESLKGDINISTPSGYEVSKDNTTFSSSVGLTQNSGTVSETTIYVRLNGSTSGSINGNLSITSQDATSVDIALTGTVFDIPVVSGVASVEFNTTATFTATTTPSAPAPWSSSNTSVGTITDSGEFTAVDLGTTTISFENTNGCIGTLEINVVDTTAPVITLTGDPTVTLEVGDTYTEQGATATDNYDTTVTVVIGGDTVDTSTVGTYTVTYDATDANNNAATQVIRTVNVEESLSVDVVNEVKLSIFPNPTSIQWNIKAENEIKSILLYDISGRKILHERPYNKNVEINAQSLRSGVYFLSVNKTNTFRLIKL